MELKNGVCQMAGRGINGELLVTKRNILVKQDKLYKPVVQLYLKYCVVYFKNC